MRILICNDDGIESGGIKTLAEKLAEKNEVVVVAPDGNRSCCSHTVTINAPIKITERKGARYRTYVISGYPVDCVKVGFHFIKGFVPDVVVAGINKSHNLGTDVLYSGTVAIALEGSYFGVPAFAFSSFFNAEIDFARYAEIAESVIAFLVPLSRGAQVWNVNFPPESLRIKGIRFCKLGKYVYDDKYVKEGYGYVLKSSDAIPDLSDKTSDVALINEGYVTITPLKTDATDYDKLAFSIEKNVNLSIER